ncbi:hypothetical protein H2200_002190 [Cladophialophora chaetospira]|uniref:O-methyltransferase domain-containing protein n=1 Tax=Cladophialophora chaetospira TaxID=386627 RepID=A0AA38XII8_9EURO|nr:hypothetical protein H2200_002190 [Cladophialophora chaetospira]
MTATTLEPLEQSLRIAVDSTSSEFKNGLKTLLQQTLRKLETPGERIWEYMFYPHYAAVVRAGIEMRLFHSLAEGAATVEELTDRVPGGDADDLLVARLLRMLAGMGVVTEVGLQKYANAAVGETLAKDVHLEGGMKFMFDVTGQSVMKLPDALKDLGYKNPSGELAAFQKAFGPGMNAFKFLGSHPSSLTDFVNLMAGQRFNRRDWFEFFPVQEKLLDAMDSDSTPLMVDVGGAQGFELQQFNKRFPNAKGKLILQDLPNVIEGITDLEDRIVRMPYDFFTPQPVKDARAYYFRSIFHDWDDFNCRKILENLKPAMKRGFSKLLINDWVLPDQGAPLYPCMLDINMMAAFSSMERTEAQWTSLLDSVGFRIVKFWTVPGNEGCIEAVLAEYDSD